MPDHTFHQKKIIERYYRHRGDIMLARLSELVGELYLAETEPKRARLWERVERAMKNLKVPQAQAARILERRDPAFLADWIRDWMAGTPKSGQ